MRLTVDGRIVNAATGAVPVDPGAPEPLVVLIHGAGMDRSVWSHQTRFLAHHGYRAVAVDLPGHGGSEGPALGSVAESAAWSARLADALGGRVHLVGHSLGALVALEAAAHHPGEIASAVLVGVAALMPVHPDLQMAADADEVRAAELITAWGHGRPQHTGHNPTPGLWMLGGTQALLEGCPPGVLALDLKASSSYEGALAAAASVSCPVTLVLGGIDRMTPRRAAQPLLDSFTGPASVTVVEVPDSGHMLMLEEPAAVRRAILDHLTRACAD